MVSSRDDGLGHAEPEPATVCPSVQTTASSERKESGERTEEGTETGQDSERTGKRLFDSEWAREAGRLSVSVGESCATRKPETLERM
jgi:hypothetical protein